MNGQRKRSLMLLVLVAYWSSPLHAADLGGIQLGEPRATAILLEAEGCRIIRLINAADQVALSKHFSEITTVVAGASTWKAEAALGVDINRRGTTLEQVEYLCEDKRYYMISFERAVPHRVMGVTMLYCSGDEAEGEAVLNRKLGIENREAIFKPMEKIGYRTVEVHRAPLLDERIAVWAHRDNRGCNVPGVGSTFMFGLSFYDRPLYREALAAGELEDRKAFDAVKPPGKL